MRFIKFVSSLINYSGSSEPSIPPAPPVPVALKHLKLTSEETLSFEEQLRSVLLVVKEDYPILKSNFKVGRVLDDADLLIKAIDGVYQLKFIQGVSPVDVLNLLDHEGLQQDKLAQLVLNLFPWRICNSINNENENQLRQCLINLNNNIEKVKLDFTRFDWRKISLSNSSALLSCEGMSEVKPLIAKAAKINLLSLEINSDQTCSLYIGYISEVLRHSPLESRSELTKLLERLHPATFIQAMILATLPNSILSKEDFRQVMREVWETKDVCYKENVKNQLEHYLSLQGDQPTLSMAINDLGGLKSIIIG